MAESKKVPDKHRISKVWVLIKASIKGTLIKSWFARTLNSNDNIYLEKIF